MKVTVEFSRKVSTGHCRQIFAGFSELGRLAPGSVEFVENDWNPKGSTHNLIRAVVNDSIPILFDTNDGFHWIHANLEENIEFFRSDVLPNFELVFKRSYNLPSLAGFGAAAARVLPLGFNYEVTTPSNEIDRHCFGWRAALKHKIRRSDLLSALLKVTGDREYLVERIERLPIPDHSATTPRILLLTRLWDPNGNDIARSPSQAREALAQERHEINQYRIECLRVCRSAFGEAFVGGLADDPYSRRVAGDLIVPASLTSKRNYTDQMHRSTICVATRGLHGSTGWRLGEYIAASRAIVSEAIADQVPGNFAAGENYLPFRSADELVAGIQRLVTDPDLVRSMMWNNYTYYRCYLRPEALILNALLRTQSLGRH